MTGLRFVIDPDRCRHCGREDTGLQCTQCVTPGYERQLVRARVSQLRIERTPWPATAPCADACPLSLCIQGYANHLAAGEIEEALRHVLVRAPLPESVCRVCDRPCESVCVRTGIDEAVAINDLKRFIVERARRDGIDWTPQRATDSARRVAVVGAGPAGLSAAWDLRVRGHAVVLYDAAERPGGILAQHIPAYRLPAEALARDIERVLSAGVELVCGTALGRDVTLAQLVDRFDAVLLAIGAHRPRRLQIAGEGEPGAPEVTEALPFLRRARAGEAARVDGPVVVVGGGNAAIDASRTARRLGASAVTIACIETRRDMPALPEEIEAAVREGIRLHTEVRPARLREDVVELEPTVDGSREAVRIEAAHVILAIGQDPELGFLSDGPALRCVDGLVDVDPDTGRTSHPRVFAAGDLVPGSRTVTRAMATGLRAAWAIDRDLRGDSADLRRPPLPPREHPTPWPRVETRHVSRRRPPEADAAARASTFEEVAGVLSEAAARAEAARCMVCGMCGNCRACVDLFGCPAIGISGSLIRIEPGLCNGCGVCADFCPNDAIVPEGGQTG